MVSSACGLSDLIKVGLGRTAVWSDIRAQALVYEYCCGAPRLFAVKYKSKLNVIHCNAMPPGGCRVEHRHSSSNFEMYLSSLNGCLSVRPLLCNSAFIMQIDSVARCKENVPEPQDMSLSNTTRQELAKRRMA